MDHLSSTNVNVFRKMRLTRLVGCSIIAAILFEIDKNMAFTQVEENRENAESLSKAVMFHENSKILLAEKFVPVEFLIPFPQYLRMRGFESHSSHQLIILSNFQPELLRLFGVVDHGFLLFKTTNCSQDFILSLL